MRFPSLSRVLRVLLNVSPSVPTFSYQDYQVRGLRDQSPDRVRPLFHFNETLLRNGRDLGSSLIPSIVKELNRIVPWGGKTVISLFRSWCGLGMLCSSSDGSAALRDGDRIFSPFSWAFLLGAYSSSLGNMPFHRRDLW